MGPFADSLFTLLLGWLSTAARSLWGLITGTDAVSSVGWVLDNWLPLLILLCLAGAVIDLVVYLIRWQPWRVWRSFLRRDHGGEAEEDSGNYRKWVYADGSTRMEIVGDASAEVTAVDDVLPKPVRRVRRAPNVANPDESYNQPYYPPQWQRDHDDEQPS